jgi:hypothetical protein
MTLVLPWPLSPWSTDSRSAGTSVSGSRFRHPSALSSRILVGYNLIGMTTQV